MNKQQIEVKEILIHWAEGSTDKYDKFPKAYASFEAVNKDNPSEEATNFLNTYKLI